MEISDALDVCDAAYKSALFALINRSEDIELVSWRNRVEILRKFNKVKNTSLLSPVIEPLVATLDNYKIQLRHGRGDQKTKLETPYLYAATWREEDRQIAGQEFQNIINRLFLSIPTLHTYYSAHNTICAKFKLEFDQKLGRTYIIDSTGDREFLYVDIIC